ncbi:MAG: virulence protein [Oscillospiraceae bacterium]|jgi:hypothetical protein|nr:virulence protein [Oscillospiraceae bacterium]
MECKYNITGDSRKHLVNAIGIETKTAAKYLGAPTFAYEVGGYTIDRNGTLTGSDNRAMVGCLKRVYGLIAESEEYDAPAFEVPVTAIATDKLVIEIPLEGFTETALANLEQLVANKTEIIKKALGADSLPIERTESTLAFPWFALTGAPGEADVYSRFATALCETAKKQKRVIAKETDVDSEKFAMRCFLLRLGFIGKEFAPARKLLTAKLFGNGSFKSGNGKKSAEENNPTLNSIKGGD